MWVWEETTSGLKLREDAFSWQAAFEKDKRFFLRRSKDCRNEFSDLLLGDLSDQQSCSLVVEFIEATGGISGSEVVFTNIVNFDAEKKVVVDAYDRDVDLARRVFASLNQPIVNICLDQSLSRWDVKITVKQR